MTTAREYHQQMVHYLRKSIDFTMDGQAYVHVGIIPAGSLILKPASGVFVSVLFNGGTEILNIGTPGNTDLFGSALSLTTTVFQPLDEATGVFLVTADTTVVAEVVLTGAAASAGAGEVVICYIPDNDG